MLGPFLRGVPVGCGTGELRGGRGQGRLLALSCVTAGGPSKGPW